MSSSDLSSAPFSGCGVTTSVSGASKPLLVNNSASEEAFKVI